MAIEIRVPTTGNAGEDAVIVDWNAAEGETVTAGDVLVVLETAKSTVDIEASADGVLLKTFFFSGEDAPEHAVLAIIGEPGETVDLSHETCTSQNLAVAESSEPESAQLSSAPTAKLLNYSESKNRIAASPRARVFAERNSVDLSTVTGTGPGARVLIMDVVAAKRDEVASPSHARSLEQSTISPTKVDYTLVPVRGARKVTAQRMTESLQTTAQVTLTRYAKADTMLKYASRLRATTERTDVPKIGVNDLLLFAAARTVAQHPAANSWFSWEGIRQFSTVNLGFAVDTGEALLVPVIRDAQTLSIGQLGRAAKKSIERARAGKLTNDEMQNGTFTVSNLGGLGVHWFTPVLNTPQSCILGVGATHQLHDDGPQLLPLSLTFDHRALDGAAAAGLLSDLVRAIENVDVLSAV